MGILLEASHEERKVRARVRAASTLDGALRSLLEFEKFSDDESQDEVKFNEFTDCQLFVMSEGDSTTDSETEKTVRELNGQVYRSKKKKTQESQHNGIEAGAALRRQRP